MEGKYKELFKYIVNTDDKCAKDIIYSVELLRSSFDSTIGRINDEINSATGSRDYTNVVAISEYCKQMLEIDEELKHVLEFLSVAQQTDKGEKSEVSPKEKSSLRTYRYGADEFDYDTDVFEKHSINEDFEYSKPYALRIHGKEIVANSWKKILLGLCAWLYHENPTKMESFIESPEYKGRKINYFSTSILRDKEGKERNTLIPETDIYVSTNLSANAIIQLIKHILTDYGYDLNSVEVYLSRDLNSKNV